ncbi:putative MFS family arabinose efflux permease [Duganella sp. 1411]|uniref:YbfB/YjiJ family MFS transporter n=1 Tax=Duganella sp. 1411 TaxID=2806572 RepID=UPI001AE20BEC|nr:YbfB/YjiJ family MFS transporter [Duganella sp. 1411]MBP1208395.1 putative MFS family arabinose efflux permease [Duganella sp. 1411]
MDIAKDKGAAARAIFAGLSASLVGIGLARFGYTPLIPPLIEAHWFAAQDVVYLGAANLVGYLVGALVGRPLAARLTARATLRVMMMLASLAFFACAFPLSVSWFFVWRLLSGVSGGIIMVLVASTVLPHVPVERRGMASGAIFLGVGVGIAASGTVVPMLLSVGLRETWLGLGALALLLSIASWFCWPGASPVHAAVAGARPAAPPVGARFDLNVLYVQYALMAIGLVPLMVFLVDYVARGLGWGTHTAALFWIAYGIGAIAGPMFYGALTDRIGPTRTSQLALCMQAGVIGLMMFSRNHVLLIAATVVVGSFPPGIVPIVLGRVHQILPGDAHGQSAVWSRATTVFALFQALAGYGYSYLFARSGGDHRLLMGIGAGALLIAVLADGVKKMLAKPRGALL